MQREAASMHLSWRSDAGNGAAEDDAEVQNQDVREDGGLGRRKAVGRPAPCLFKNDPYGAD
jgi:hypothetical protein